MRILGYIFGAIDGTKKIDPVKANIVVIESADKILIGVLSAIYFVVGAFAVVVIILAGYTFLMSAGDPAKVTKARNAILYAVIGLIVVIFAFVITQFVIGRF
jgi:hypothetical protein